MIIIRTPREMREWALAQRQTGKTIGCVPTMGALHEGHASLMREAVAKNDVGVASLFVNPKQFAPHEDFGKYPRMFEADCAMAEQIGITAVYAPDVETMYPDGYQTYVTVEEVSQGLCGAARPHHCRGVTTVVTKLFNAMVPHRAYFGQKDAQQCAVIKRMARDLDMGIEIVEMPIVREADGLAMSSRNAYLSPEERQRALCLSRSLFRARDIMELGERNARKIIHAVREGMADVDIDYVELADADSLKPVEHVQGTIVLAAAAFLGKTRLIDNIKFEAK